MLADLLKENLGLKFGGLIDPYLLELLLYLARCFLLFSMCFPFKLFALAEADVARLKQKVAELHHQLNQQRQHHYGSLSDGCDLNQHGQNNNPQQSEELFLMQQGQGGEPY